MIKTNTALAGRCEPLGDVSAWTSTTAGKLPPNRAMVVITSAGPDTQVKELVFHLLEKKRPTEREAKTCLSANKPSYLGGRKYLHYTSVLA